MQRHQGGQPGNQNARKHGYYSRRCTPAERQSLSSASPTADLDGEIALLRVKLKSLVKNDPGNTRLLLKGFLSLARLLQTRQLSR